MISFNSWVYGFVRNSTAVKLYGNFYLNMIEFQTGVSKTPAWNVQTKFCPQSCLIKSRYLNDFQVSSTHDLSKCKKNLCL